MKSAEIDPLGAGPEVVSSVVATAGQRGRGLDALFSPENPFPLAELAIAAQALAMLQLERIERPGEEDDVCCRGCHVTWVLGGIPRPHLESCMVGRALHLAELALSGQVSTQAAFVATSRVSPIELQVWACHDAPADSIHMPGDPVLDHHGRAELAQATTAFPTAEPGSRIFEVSSAEGALTR